MERLFKALANRDALWIVVYLAARGPQQQKDLIAALHAARPGQPERNSGSMSNLVAPLIRAGIVERGTQTSALQLARPEQARRLLTLAAAMAVATTAEASQEADQQHASLMRAITQASDANAAGSAS
jgi:hypothetical protein